MNGRTSSVHRLHEISLDANSVGRIFEGIGAVSAGASSRLVFDYNEPHRSRILDYLFKPKFGCGFQHLKVEVGGGENSTCGSEPSHAITQAELADPKPRGYEFWLMSEARQRNPEIILDCLPWCYPHWVGDRFSERSAQWLAAFLSTARRHFGLELDWLSAAQNEMGTDLRWIKEHLRPELNKQGFGRVRLQAPDFDALRWHIFDDFETESCSALLVDAVGYHYLDGREPWDIDQQLLPPSSQKARDSGKALWASEEWSQSGKSWGGTGALYLARLINKLYNRDRVTNFQIWCPIDGIYDQIIWGETGVMQADSPWCGSYSVWPAVWAVAHTTQFAEPGWVYMDDACGQIDPKSWRGSHVSLRNPRTGDWSVIICTGDPCEITINVGAGLKQGPVRVWRSRESDQFVRVRTLRSGRSQYKLALEGDAIYTLTTTSGQRKGANDVPPVKQPFPFPFEENFDGYRPGDMARYFADQKGAFEVANKPGGGLCLAQIVPQQGILWRDVALLKPHTLFGDKDWRDYTIEADVFIEAGDVEIGGRFADRDNLGYRWMLSRQGRWQLNWLDQVLARGQLANVDPLAWHRMKLVMHGNCIAGLVDGEPLVDLQHKGGSGGMAFLASTYDRNLFSRIRVL